MHDKFNDENEFWFRASSELNIPRWKLSFSLASIPNRNHRNHQIKRASESNRKSRSNNETRLFANDRNGDEDDASTSTPPPTTTSIHSFSSPWMPNWEQNNKQRPCLPVMVQQNSRRASKNKERKLAENNGNQQNAIAIATLPRNIAVPPPSARPPPTNSEY